jgi:hypothetical protein
MAEAGKENFFNGSRCKRISATWVWTGGLGVSGREAKAPSAGGRLGFAWLLLPAATGLVGVVDSTKVMSLLQAATCH